MPHSWKCSMSGWTGLWAPWPSKRCPCPWHWTAKTVLRCWKVPSDPKHSVILKFYSLCLVYTYMTLSWKMQMPTCATTTEKALSCLLSVKESAILQSQPSNKQFLWYYKHKAQAFILSHVNSQCNIAINTQNCFCVCAALNVVLNPGILMIVAEVEHYRMLNCE